MEPLERVDGPPPAQTDEATLAVANGQVVLPPFGNIWYRVAIPANVVSAHLGGEFSTAGDSGVVVKIDDGKQKGRRTQVFWGTPAPQTAGSFDVALNPGTYYVYFIPSNEDLQKTLVNVNVQLLYQRL